MILTRIKILFQRVWQTNKLVFSLLIVLVCQFGAFAQSADLEFLPIQKIEIVYENAPTNTSTEGLASLVRGAVGEEYSPIRVREALQKLFESKRVINARVEADKVRENNRDAVRLRFVVRRQLFADRISLDVAAPTSGKAITQDELIARLNIIAPNEAVTEQTLGRSADVIQTYLRDKGFYKAEVTYAQTPNESEATSTVRFNVKPNAQAKVEKFDLQIQGFDDSKIVKNLKLKPDENFSRDALNSDLAKIRAELVKQDFLAPSLDEPKVVYDNDTNRISISLNGNVGAKVKVKVENTDKTEGAPRVRIGEASQRKLFPIKREGTIEQSAIVEGARRLKNKLQEDGYFFADVGTVCAVNPPLTELAIPNNTNAVCEVLSSVNLQNKEAAVNYEVSLNRRLRLVDIRITGTNKFTIDDIRQVLQTQQANSLLGLVPRLGYGRGYTSVELLEQDRQTIRALMKELGYRDAQVNVRRGVSPTGDDLIITFAVKENLPTVISAVEFKGNQAFAASRLKIEIPTLVGRNFSRARAGNATAKLQEFYAQKGYFEARVNYSLVELPSADGEPKKVKLIYEIENEGTKNFVNRIVVVGNDKTKREAILETATVREGKLLRSDYITQSEQNLYATDAFRQITIETEPAGTDADGDQQRDVIINVEESQPRILNYGFGYSSEGKGTGFFDIRHVNLFGKLYQGGARLQLSQRQQIAQIDFLQPRFLRDGNNQFAPLSLSAQYIRDSQVTRFFRSTIDQGALGIVQRVDANGNPIDQFGQAAGVPTINRLTLTAETNRTIDRKSRSILFLRYRYEDVRLYNIRSLLIADILEPDRVTRISGIGATFARDTRENCSQRLTLLNRIRTGEDGNSCRYSSGEPTKGDYLTSDFSFSARQLGGNISFYKLQVNYQRYFKPGKFFGDTVFAGRTNFGVAGLFNVQDRNRNGTIDETDKTLPISERFFSGGSTTIRGFAFEEAGPRVVIVPQGQFRDRNRNPVFLKPFTVPIGGNALAFVNLEARIPLTSAIQAVPFYDGGNVFRRFGDLLKPRTVAPGDIYNANLRSLWSNTVGMGFRVKTPIGGAIAVDYGYLLNPPQFIIPQITPPNSIYRLRQGQIHFRFTQAF